MTLIHTTNPAVPALTKEELQKNQTQPAQLHTSHNSAVQADSAAVAQTSNGSATMAA